MKKEWSIQKALFILIGSTFCNLVISLSIFFLWQTKRKKKLHDEKYHIQYIVQTGPEKKALETDHLAEILNLSSDAPTSLYAFDTKEATKRLLASPLIAKAKVKKIFPSSLYIDYEVRKPVALLCDFKNIAIDETGHLFPISPFFSPKKLPEIYLGIKEATHFQVEGPTLDLALAILHFLKTAPWNEGVQIERVDVSSSFSQSLGTREIVILTEEEMRTYHKGKQITFYFPKTLRLTPKDYQEQLSRFFALRKQMHASYQRQLVSYEKGGRFMPRIIDLRIPQLAFLQK